MDCAGDEPAGVGAGGTDEVVMLADGAGDADPSPDCVPLGVADRDGAAGVEAAAEEVAASLASALSTWSSVRTWPPVPVMP